MSAALNSIQQLMQRLMAGRDVRAMIIIALAYGIQFCCGLLSSVIVARYLGPHQLGTLSYVLALVGFAGTFAMFGLTNAVTRELLSGTYPIGTVLGTAVRLRAATGAISIVALLIYLHFFESNGMFVALASLAAGTLLFDGELIFDRTLQAKRAFGASAKAKVSVALSSLLMRVVLITSSASLIYFFAVQYAEFICYIAIMGWATREYLRGVKATWDWSLAKALARESVPVLLAAFAISVYMRIDQVMIMHMLGGDALGQYTICVKLTEVAAIIPTVFYYVMYPTIIEARKISAEKVEAEVIKLYRMMYITGFMFAITITLLSDWIVHLLYGAAYADAGPVLRVYVWSSIFVFLTIAGHADLLSQAKTSHVVTVRTTVGAIANIGLNLIMIPRMGIIGAAWATVISYGISVFFFYDRKYSWPPVRSMLRALKLPV